MSERSFVRNLASEMAQYAFESAKNAKAKNLKEYPQYVKKLPTMIRNAGYIKAIAFGYSKKEKAEGKVYEEIYQNIINWLNKKKIIDKTMSTEKFILHLIKLETSEYRRVINETMKFLDWLRRFAEGMFDNVTSENTEEQQ
ncbi:MAG: type III-B CRISPR module-associated protein Cmr5 [bacterium]